MRSPRATGSASATRSSSSSARSSSGQSFIDAPFAEEVCRLVLEAAPGAAIVLSAARGAAGAARDPRILDGSELSYRETAGLTRFSTLLVGGSSGITWLATAEGCKRLPMIQLLRRRSGVYASMVHDRRHFGLPADDVIEMTDCSPAHAARCITTVLERGVPFARARFHEEWSCASTTISTSCCTSPASASSARWRRRSATPSVATVSPPNWSRVWREPQANMPRRQRTVAGEN